MKKRLGVLLLICGILLSGCVNIVNHTPPKVIGVVAKGMNNSFWDAVLAGAEDAAMENGYAITFRGPETDGTEGIQAQRDMVRLALDNEVCALVLATVGPGFDDLLTEAHEMDIPVVEFDSGIWPGDLQKLKDNKCSPVVASVYTDSRKAGALAARNLFEAIREEIAASVLTYKVGVIQHDLTISGRERAQGFQETFQALGEEDPLTAGKIQILVEQCPTEKDNCYGRALDRLMHQGVRAVFLTNEVAVNQVYDRITEHPGRYEHMVFAGFDGGKKQVDWLRKYASPRLVGSVSQNAYQIGYKAVTQCVNAMETRGVTAFVNIQGNWYDKTNMEDMITRGLVAAG